jgi:hypothetical protein
MVLKREAGWGMTAVCLQLVHVCVCEYDTLCAARYCCVCVCV